MKKRQLLAILRGICFFAVATSANGEEAQPQIDTIDIFEAVRIAESMLLSHTYYVDLYANRKIEIESAVRYATQRNLESRSQGTVHDALVDRVYWMVSFSYTKPILDGGRIYYIDAETSELINVHIP